METIKLHDRLDDIAPLLSSVEGCILRLLLTVEDPLKYVQKKLESNKMTGSLVVSLISDLRTSLTDVLDNLREPAPDEDKTGVTQIRAMLLLPCTKALLKDLNSHLKATHGG